MFCPNCGKQIEDDSIFCSSCGENISNRRHSMRPQRAQARPKGNILKIALIACAVLGVLVAGFLIWNALSSSNLPAACHYSITSVKTYDVNGDLLESTEFSLNNRGMQVERIDTEYDASGNPIESDTTHFDTSNDYGISVAIDDSGDTPEVVVLEEDEFGQPLKYQLQYADDDVITYDLTYYGEGMVESFTREPSGSKPDYEYFVIENEFDENGWQSSQRTTVYYGIIDTRDTFTYEYDDGGLVVSQTEISESGSETTYTFEYNSDGMVETMTEDDGTYHCIEYQYVRDPAPFVAAENYIARGQNYRL